MAQVKDKESGKPKTTSRLVARLREISRGQVTPLGFARAAVSKLPSMLLLAEVDSANSAAVKAALDAGSDGIVLRVGGVDLPAAESLVREVVASAGEKTVGVLLDGDRVWSAEDVETLAKAGADYVIVRPSRAPAGLLKVESLGHIALVDGDLSKFPIRGLNEQHVDAMMLGIDRPQGSLPAVTVQDVAAWRSVLEAFRRPIILPAPSGLLPSDLEFVRESGAEAVLVPASSADAAGALSALRAAIDALGPPVGRGRGTEGRQVFLPSVRPAADEDEDDDE